MYIELNINPDRKQTGDCVIRSIGAVIDKEWDDVFLDLMAKSFQMKEMPSQNNVWGSYLHDLGFKKHVIPDSCPDCYTVNDFTRDHPQGRYVVGTGSHAVAVIDGNHYDVWDSGEEIPVYYFEKESING